MFDAVNMLGKKEKYVAPQMMAMMIALNLQAVPPPQDSFDYQSQHVLLRIRIYYELSSHYIKVRLLR